jgi:hypothetical protein
LALKSDGRVEAWGSDDTWGQCDVPAGLTNAVAVAAGLGHSLALRADGTVLAWGNNSDGQCQTPAYAGTLVAISTSQDHNLALRANRTVLAWGYNGFGQCNVPPDATNAVAVAAGWYHSLSLATNGAVLAWGQNSSGQCNVPLGLTNAIAIAAGSAHSLAVRADGTVVAWGDNALGQCNVPSGITNAIAVAAGHSHSLALLADGTVLAWGDNANGQCDVPLGLPRVTALAANSDHSSTVVNLAAPSILSASPGQTLAIGSSVSLFVLAAGAPPLAYQWFHNGSAIPGATNAQLLLPAVAPAQAGEYVAFVINNAGSTATTPITLTLLPGLNVRMCPAISLAGDPNKQYWLEFVPAMGQSVTWQVLATVTITNIPQLYFDVSGIGQPSRFYRLVAVP